MSSAISTRRGLLSVPPASGRPQAAPEGASGDAADAGFRPWHFFVLSSLVAATAAVLMSRQSAPAHLILLSLMIGAAGAAAAAVYRMLAPLAVRDVTLTSQRQSERGRAALEREKALVLRSIKELEFDRAMGKVSPRDFDEMAARLRARAMMLIRQADERATGYRELIERELSARLVTRSRGAASRPPSTLPEPDEVMPPQALDEAPAAPATLHASLRCEGCGTANDADAAFCKRCGTPLELPA